MRYFRHLPPLVRVVSLVGWLLRLVVLVVFLVVLRSSLVILRSFLVILPASFFQPPISSVDANRLVGIELNLAILSVVCSAMVHLYTVRFRQTGRSEPFPLASWQSQVRWLVLVAAMPLGALALAVLLTRTPLLNLLLVPPTFLGAVIFWVAYITTADRWHALN